MKKSEKTKLAYVAYQDAECVWQSLRRNEYEDDADLIYQNEESARRYLIRARKLLTELLEELESDS